MRKFESVNLDLTDINHSQNYKIGGVIASSEYSSKIIFSYHFDSLTGIKLTVCLPKLSI